ncbi:MAG: cyclic-di-AMP receptor [Chloroflexota bacterium]
MKMIVAILDDEDAEVVIQALHEADFIVSCIDSTGGFLRQGTSTLMIGSDETRIDQAIQIINTHCAPTIEPIQRKATIFVLHAEHFEQM